MSADISAFGVFSEDRSAFDCTRRLAALFLGSESNENDN